MKLASVTDPPGGDGGQGTRVEAQTRATNPERVQAFRYSRQQSATGSSSDVSSRPAQSHSPNFYYECPRLAVTSGPHSPNIRVACQMQEPRHDG